jgi:putative ABC transport system permease protein
MRITPQDTFGMAFGAIWANRFRSALTILGIVIGITTVVTVGSLLAGVKQSIIEFFREFGPDSIFIAKVSGDPSGQNAPPKERRRKPFRADYADTLRTFVHSIDDVATTLSVNPPSGSFFSAKVPGYETENMSLSGVTPNLYSISPRELRQGRLFTQEEARRAAQVALLGSGLADALFPNGNAVGSEIQVNGVTYNVVGVFAPAKGGFFGENGLDREISIPFETARVRYPQANNYFMTAKASPGRRQDAIDEIRATMRRIRHTPKNAADDFTISTPDSIIENFNKITGMILLISIAISGLGLLVGGIGVMNIMLVSVTERTREIGVRKALGARRQDIVTQFLTEAVALTGAGGVIGVIVAVIMTMLIGVLLPSLPSVVPLWAVLTGFTVSVAIGIFFGVWPAVKASRLDPVVALRYE